MKLKVCGMREADNIRDLLELEPDYMGMIFYEKSPRCVLEMPKADLSGVEKVGVFVNASDEEMKEKAQTYGLDLLQLHGEEPVDQVKRLKEHGFKLIKVFSVADELPIALMQAYSPYVDYFLFDTKTPAYGGSGQKFDWGILKDYDLEKPFFLSGGIELDDLDAIRQLGMKQLYAIDVNSRFELAPAVKDIKKIKALKDKL